MECCEEVGCGVWHRRRGVDMMEAVMEMCCIFSWPGWFTRLRLHEEYTTLDDTTITKRNKSRVT